MAPSRVGRKVQAWTDVSSPGISTTAPHTLPSTNLAEIHHQCRGMKQLMNINWPKLYSHKATPHSAIEGRGLVTFFSLRLTAQCGGGGREGAQSHAAQNSVTWLLLSQLQWEITRFETTVKPQAGALHVVFASELCTHTKRVNVQEWLQQSYQTPFLSCCDYMRLSHAKGTLTLIKQDVSIKAALFVWGLLSSLNTYMNCHTPPWYAIHLNC